MRLSPNKIDYIAEMVLDMIEKTPTTHIQTNPDLVYRAVSDVIFDNMRAEDAIEEEVDQLLENHRNEISAQDMDYGSLRMNMKREIAKKRGFVL
jgi:hypothetical protein